jgi:hypothetical protein
MSGWSERPRKYPQKEEMKFNIWRRGEMFLSKISIKFLCQHTEDL